MKLNLQIGNHRFTVDPHGSSLAKRLEFNGSQGDFGVEPAMRKPVLAGDFVGDTSTGGSCNVDWLSIIPHCHGTHTETMGHIVNQPLWIVDHAPPTWMLCALMTVDLQSGAESNEEYVPVPMAHDQLITAEGLEAARSRLEHSNADDILKDAYAESERALVVRCHPVNPREASEEDSLSRLPPYFSNDAIRWCIKNSIHHLLLESPSIDRVEDSGLLTNHHLYWNVPGGTHESTSASWASKTITESIAIAPEISDGIYLLNLQVPAICSDAAPSRPILHAIESWESLS